MVPQLQICVRLRSMSSIISTSNPQIHVRFLSHRHMYLRSMSFFQILKSASNSQIYVLFQILKSMDITHLLKSTSNNVTDVCPNPNQEISHRSLNSERTPIWEYIVSLNRTMIWDNDVSGCRFESRRWSESIICNHDNYSYLRMTNIFKVYLVHNQYLKIQQTSLIINPELITTYCICTILSDVFYTCSPRIFKSKLEVTHFNIQITKFTISRSSVISPS